VGGHLGTKKTLDRITSNIYRPGITSDVKRLCRSCDICLKTMPKRKVGKVPLGRIPLIDTPFRRIAIDLIGELFPISDSGHRYILTVVDFSTRYPEAVALSKIDTETVSEALLGIFCRVGFPREVLSDQGRQFISDLMKEVSRLVSIKQLFTAPYNPKYNELCEKMNGVPESMLKKLCQERRKEWDRYLPAVLFAYREVPQASMATPGITY
jgi:transposase InsO family protein